jgi:serine/threonine protein kinase
MIRIDSMTMNILTASERIVNIYSHCGVSVHVEPMRGANIDEVVMPSEREGKEDVLPPLLSPTEKITTALMMAEALADLHGYTGGAIGHFDIQMGQYLFNEDGHLKLSDFNRAGPLMWNEAEQEYCRFWMGSAGGNVRSPEEYHEQVPVDYSVDVYSYGNVIFTLLTGEEPYGGEYVDVRHLCGKGITPKVDLAIRGRSFAEAFLATIMDKCFEFYPEKRIDIFTIVSLLKEAISINSRLESIEVTYSEEEEEELFQSGDENEDHGTGTESYYDSEDYNYTHYPSVHNEYREDEVDGDIDE